MKKLPVNSSNHTDGKRKEVTENNFEKTENAEKKGTIRDHQPQHSTRPLSTVHQSTSAHTNCVHCVSIGQVVQGDWMIGTISFVGTEWT